MAVLGEWSGVEEGTEYEEKTFTRSRIPVLPITNLTGYWDEDICGMGCSRGFIWEGSWVTSTAYVVQDVSLQCNSSVVIHNGTSYVCIVEHTSAAATEPGVGASWETNWEIMASIGNIGVAGIEGLGFEWRGGWVTSYSYKTQDSGTYQASDVTVNDDISYVCILDHTSAAATEPGVGASWETYWDVYSNAGGGVGNVVWRQYWITANSYLVNDFVSHNGYSYMCIQPHTADSNNEPDAEFDLEPGGNVWQLVSTGFTPDERSYLEQITDGVMDWIADATPGDWVQALAIGAGVIWAGSEILDMFEADPEGDGNADTQYTGSDGYNASWVAVELPDLVDTLCLWAGLTSYDTSLLPTKTVNITLSTTTSARQMLEQLTLAYQFDMVDSGGTLKFVPRTGASVRTLTYDDMGYVEGDNDSDVPYTATRAQGIDLPKSVSLTYFSDELNHNQYTQTRQFATYDVGQNIEVSLPFTMSHTDAQLTAEAILVNAHIERTGYTFTLSYDHIDLEPTDVITTPMGILRILEVKEKVEGILEVSTSSAEYNDITYEATGGIALASPATSNDVPVVIGYSQSLFLEVPPLSASDIEPRLLIAAHGYGLVGWTGASLYESNDAGGTYQSLFTDSDTSTIGIVKAADTEMVAFNEYHYWDDTTTITVETKAGTLSSRTKEDVLKGYNFCMIGEEVIGFTTATLIATDKYTLSGLLRGRRGTEWKCLEGHVANELFVLLDGLIPYTYPVEDLNKPKLFKTVTVGSSLDVTSSTTVQPYGKNLRPWSPALLAAVKPATAWNITWIERPRLDNTLKDNVEIGHDPDWQGYAVTMLDPTTSAVIRTTITQVPNWSYTEAMQIADFGSVRTQVKVQVQQTSKTVGGGYSSIITAGTP